MQHEFKSHGEKRRCELQQRMKAERARADAENEAGPGVAVERQVTPLPVEVYIETWGPEWLRLERWTLVHRWVTNRLYGFRLLRFKLFVGAV